MFHVKFITIHVINYQWYKTTNLLSFHPNFSLFLRAFSEKFVPSAPRQIVFTCHHSWHQYHWSLRVLVTCARTCTIMTHQGSNALLRSPCGPQGEDRPSGKASSAHPRGENGKAGPSPDTSSQPLPNFSVSLHKAPEKRKQKKINIDEAEGKNLTTFLSLFVSVALLLWPN